MIEQVEKFRAELNLLRFGDFKIFLHCQVKINQTGSAEIADFGVSETMSNLLSRGKWWRNEGSLIKPAIQGLMAGVGASVDSSLRSDIEREVIRVGYLVRTITKTSRIAEIR